MGPHGVIALIPLGPEPGVCRDASALCPPRAVSPWVAAFARVASGCPASRSSYFSTKGLRCIAFFGVKPPGQSEISAFFRSIATQKV